jgi:hypothetical protein
MYDLVTDTDGDGVLDFVEVCVNGTNPEVFDNVTVTPTVTPEVTENVTPVVTEEIEPTVSVTPTVTNAVTPEVTEEITPTVTEEVEPTVSVTPTQGIDSRTDTDNDGLSDEYEIQIGTDISNPDTDGDGVSDYIEVVIGYDPLSNDSDSNGVLDSQEDFDGDGIPNLQEIQDGTDCILNDSDFDGLSDYDELYVYETNPNLNDSDEDGVLDGDEVLLGKNPLDSSDSDIRVLQTISTQINNEEDSAITSVDISMETEGKLANVAYVQDLYNIDEYSTNVYGRLGSPIGLNSSVDFDLASIAIHYDESKLGDTLESNLGVLWFNEETGFYIIQEQAIVDTENNVVTLDLTHFSTYVLVDLTKWNNPELSDYSTGIYIAYDDYEDFDFTIYADQLDAGNARYGPSMWQMSHGNTRILSVLSMRSEDVRADENITVRHYYFEYLVMNTQDRNYNGIPNILENGGMLGTNGTPYNVPTDGSEDWLSNFDNIFFLYRGSNGSSIQIIDYISREVVFTGSYGSIPSDSIYAGLSTFMNKLAAGQGQFVCVPKRDDSTQRTSDYYYNQINDLTGTYASPYNPEICEYLSGLIFSDINGDLDRYLDNNEDYIRGLCNFYAYLRNSGMTKEEVVDRMSYLDSEYKTRIVGLSYVSEPDLIDEVAASINSSLVDDKRQSIFANYMEACDTVAQYFVTNIAYYSDLGEKPALRDNIDDYYIFGAPGIINGRSVRADCSGMVSAILVQAELLEISALNSSSYSYEYGQRDTWPDSVVYEMEAAGFVWHDYYEGIELQQGDIMVKPDIDGPNGHIEIFNNLVFENEIYTFLFYSWGKVYPAEPYTSVDTVYNGRYNNYLGFWRYEG